MQEPSLQAEVKLCLMTRLYCPTVQSPLADHKVSNVYFASRVTLKEHFSVHNDVIVHIKADCK